MAEKTQQDLILESNSKRIVVLACPGSGKTTTLTKKIIQLYNSGVSLKRILTVTFTRRATKEMYERISSQIPVSKSEQRNISTLHSFGCRILYKYKDVVGLADDFSVALKSEKEAIVKTLIPDEGDANEIITAFLEYVSSVKNGFEINKFGFTKEQFDQYCEQMIQSNLIDLDDYIYLPVKILKENRYIREKISARYDYVFVDEYQDINKIQNDFLDLLINENTNVVYVGDDDQSIYEFRGSNPNYILDKSSEKSGYDVFFLTRNFRSEKPIVEFSKKILTELKCKGRRDKIIEAHKDKSTLKPVRHVPFNNKDDEIQFVVDEIYRLITKTYIEPKEIAVLCRFTSKKNKSGVPMHPELSEIERKLKERGISASTSISMESDNETAKKIKKLCETLLSFSRESIIPEFCNLIDSNSYSKAKFPLLLDSINTKYGTNFSTNDVFTTTMDQLINLNPEIEPKSSQIRINKLINSYKFVKLQFDLVKDGAMPSQIITNLTAYIIDNDYGYDSLKDIYEYGYSFAKSCEDSYEPDEDGAKDEYSAIVQSMNAFLCSTEKNESKNCVRLLTAHQSKGLQFDAVFVVGLEAGSFPCNIEELDDQNLDNERRLFYVCVTRARELLYLTSTGFAVDENKDLADKSFIYNVPEGYFSTKVETFEGIEFTISDSETLKHIKEKDQMIDQLENEQFIALTKLNEALNKINIIEKENNELSKSIRNNVLSKDQIDTYKKKINKLLDEANKKDSYLNKLNSQIENLKSNEDYYRSEIERLNSLPSSESIATEKEEVIKKWNRDKITLKETEKKCDSLNRLLKDEEEKTKILQEQLSNIKPDVQIKEVVKVIEKEVIKEIPKYIEVVKESSNKIDVILNTIVSFPSNVVSDEIKELIKHQFDLFINKKRYPHLRSYFESGLSMYQDLIEATIEFLNGNTNADIYKTKLKAFNFKGNLAVLVKDILGSVTSYSNLLQYGEFNINRFIDAYLNRKDPLQHRIDPKYEKLVKNYKCSRHFKQLDKGLLNNMYVLYAITTTCNHEKTRNDDLIHLNYQKIVNDYLNSPSSNYYTIISSFFIFISLFINDEDLMILVR